jgi:fatty-acyl-CoA synthase
MRGLMMDGPLTLDAVLRRAETVFGGREIVTRGLDGPPRRTDYATLAERARRLAAGLGRLGVRPGDRVATLCMNHDRHLELYFAVPALGAILHTLNPRLHPDDLALIVRDAGDRAIVADEGLVPVLDALRERADPGEVIVAGEGAAPEGAIGLEELVADDSGVARAEPDERDAAFLCYTSGTTGAPKGVLYSHRALVVHSLVSAHADSMDVREADSVMPVVPMFHVNAWGIPYTAAMIGADLVMPGKFMAPEPLAKLIESERVTIAGAVPTIWMGLLQWADERKPDLSSLRTVVCGGAAVPESLMRAFEERHGVKIMQAWGMTETSPIGAVARPPAEAEGDEHWHYRTATGRIVPLVDVRLWGDDGEVPWDGESTGEVEVRGPWIAREYYEDPSGADRFHDGWLRTGDVASIDPKGFLRITDRAKDLIKSGGEWISSVELENALMSHPDVIEAAVIAKPDERWTERPLACVVCREGASPSPEDLRRHLEPQVAKWWLPDEYAFIEAVPKTSVGKFDKKVLRSRLAEGALETAPAQAAETAK